MNVETTFHPRNKVNIKEYNGKKHLQMIKVIEYKTPHSFCKIKHRLRTLGNVVTLTCEKKKMMYQYSGEKPTSFPLSQ